MWFKNRRAKWRKRERHLETFKSGFGSQFGSLVPGPFEDAALYSPYSNWASKVTSPLAGVSKATAFTWGFNSMTGVTSQPTCFNTPSSVVGSPVGTPAATHSSACAYMTGAPGAHPGYHLYGGRGGGVGVGDQYSPSSLSQFRLKSHKSTSSGTGNGFGCSTHAQSSLPQCQYTGLPASSNL